MKKNWRIVTFDKNKKFLESWTIENCTEQEAFNQADSDTKRDSKVHTWKMTEVIIRDVKFS